MPNYSFRFCLSLGTLVCLLFFATSVQSARCLYVSSYHEEYEWDAGIRNGLEPLLADHCELRKFFMDTKRNKEKAFAQQKAGEALALIKQYKPDIIIAADDNASLYLVAPYLKNNFIPVVFCGINNSAEPYGYPYKNTTGMVEVTPVQPILKVIKQTLPGVTKGIFLSADVLSQRRMYERLEQSFAQQGIKLESRFVSKQDAWEEAWKAANKDDFIFVGNPAGIAEWDKQRARRFTINHAETLTVSAWDWLAPLVMMTISKVPEEQGEWAAKVAIEILNGVSPSMIPVVINRRWHMFINKKLLNLAAIKLPADLVHNAKEVSL